MKTPAIVWIFALAGLMMTFVPRGHAVPSQSSGDESSLVSPENAQRVKVYGPWSHTRTIDGEILVCLPQYRSEWTQGCKDSKGGNAWQSLYSTDLPGFEIAGIQYKTVSSDLVHLYVYYRKKQ